MVALFGGKPLFLSASSIRRSSTGPLAISVCPESVESFRQAARRLIAVMLMAVVSVQVVKLAHGVVPHGIRLDCPIYAKPTQPPEVSLAMPASWRFPPTDRY